MFNKKIQFGNNECYIVDDETKQKVIDYLYSKLDLSKYRYIMLNSIDKLKFLQENEHYVSPNFKGYNYLLIMMMINNKPICVAVDRRKLSYHKHGLDMKTIQIIRLNLRTTENMFMGTIFDGKLIQSNNEYIFLIQDSFYLMGKKILDMEIMEKLTYLDSIFKNNFKKENNINLDFKLNKLCKYEDLEKLITGLNKISIPTNGIIFYPKYSGITVLHTEKRTDKIEINTKNNEMIENKSYHIIYDFVNFLKSRTYNYESGSKIKQLWLLRTIIPDVYDILEKEDSEKLGIALIPNLKISQMCDDIIKDNPVKFNCIFSNKFKKWIPLSIYNI